MRNHYFKSENKTDNSDFTIFGMKIGPVPDLQELPHRATLIFKLDCLGPVDYRPSTY